MEIRRDYYLNELKIRENNGLIKVITGVRRCGKSYLLFNIFYCSSVCSFHMANWHWWNHECNKWK